MVHVIYASFLAISVIFAQHYLSQLRRISSAERAAAQMLADQHTEYTAEGFSLAALAFLEKNRDLFPDSYVRAKELCERENCVGSDGDGVAGVTHAYAKSDVSSAFAGLLKGIATLSSE